MQCIYMHVNIVIFNITILTCIYTLHVNIVLIGAPLVYSIGVDLIIFFYFLNYMGGEECIV